MLGTIGGGVIVALVTMLGAPAQEPDASSWSDEKPPAVHEQPLQNIEERVRKLSESQRTLAEALETIKAELAIVKTRLSAN